MKKIKTVLSALMAALVLLSLPGCSGKEWLDRLKEAEREISRGYHESGVSPSDSDNEPATIDVLLDALDKGDKEQFKSVFSKTTLRIAIDMDRGLDYIFGIYEGQYVETVYHNFSSTKHYGDKNTALVNPIYVIRTSADKYYRICYSIWTVQEEDPDSLGIYSLDFTECDKDQEGVGGGSWIAGITYPEREGAEIVSGAIARNMISGDSSYIRKVMSDELLAVEGIDRRLTAFSEDYSTINPSTVGDCWLRIGDGGIFGYMMINTRPRTFIVFKMSDKQPDKMDGMKVTIVPVDADIPQNDIEPEETGLYFPKFPHPKPCPEYK